jgi:hypothetical protein
MASQSHTRLAPVTARDGVDTRNKDNCETAEAVTQETLAREVNTGVAVVLESCDDWYELCEAHISTEELPSLDHCRECGDGGEIFDDLCVACYLATQTCPECGTVGVEILSVGSCAECELDWRMDWCRRSWV